MAIVKSVDVEGFEVHMYPKDHLPHHFHLINTEINLRIFYRISLREQALRYNIKSSKNSRKKQSLLNSNQKREILKEIRNKRSILEKEWAKWHR